MARIEEEKQEKKLEPEAGDVAHAVTKALISAVPYIGGPAAELFSFLIVPPLQRRRDEWMKSIADGLRELEQKVEGFKIEDLKNNDIFITTMMHASQAAIRNHQKEKLEALRNAVLNAALPNPPEEDLQLMFLDFVDTLTPWHLQVLKFFDAPRGYLQAQGIDLPTCESGTVAEALEYTFPALKGRRPFSELVVRDLELRGLLWSVHLDRRLLGDRLFVGRSTALGWEFLKFVASPVEGTE